MPFACIEREETQEVPYHCIEGERVPYQCIERDDTGGSTERCIEGMRLGGYRFAV